MAQRQSTINLIAPGFLGINTEESPLGQEPSFAAVADNCIIDSFARLAARKGFNTLTTDKTELGTESITNIHKFEDTSGNEVVFSTGNNKILSGTVTLVDETPGSYAITSDEWEIVNFNDHAYFFQRGMEPLVYSNTLAAVTKMSTIGSYSAPTGRSDVNANIVSAAYGRLWAADFTDDKQTIYWSDLLQGHVWTGGSSGSIDVSEFWPNGYDEIVNIAAHNGLLIVFGRNNILVYSGADTPSTMALDDTITGVGLFDYKGVVNIGTDVLFMAHDGLRSFGRTIQEKSLPINNLSKNIQRDLMAFLATETSNIRMEYSPENNMVLVGLRTADIIYCFDIRQTLENGSYRVTRWTSTGWTAFHREPDGVLYLGSTDGIGDYSGYTDNGESYLLIYESQNLTFGDSARLKILKKIRPTLIGGNGESVTFKWGYGFDRYFRSQTVTLASNAVSEYGESEYNIGTFSDGIIIDSQGINTNGNGSSVLVGMEATIDGSLLSLQEINVYTLVGRTL